MGPVFRLRQQRMRTRSVLERLGLTPVPIAPEKFTGAAEWVECGDARAVVESVGEGPPILSLPGFAGTSRAWLPLASRLAPRWRLLMVDPPGFALADKPAGADYSAESQARRVLGVMDRLDIDAAALMATSGTGPAGLAAAAMAPDRIKALILVAPFLSPSALARWAIRIAGNDLVAPVAGRIASLRTVVGLANVMGMEDSRSVTDEIIDEQYLPFGAPGFVRASFEILKHLAPDYLDRLLPSITVPVLAVHGETDLASDQARTRQLLNLLPDVKQVELEHCGHVIQREFPDELATLIDGFLDRRSAGVRSNAAAA